MKFDWNPEKNEWLKRTCGISFEEIALLLGDGQLWMLIDHWNQEKYPGQEIFLLPIDDYIHLVPFVRDGEIFFLKTAIPSRKATREYKKEKGLLHENS
ncbi:MAG: toxin [Bacteroidia bacterium]|nr:toxin [Bacteroidia bacterium]